MASSLSEEEFHRLQAQFIDLRSANYNLEERCRKQNSELEILRDRYEALDRDYQKTQRILAKSKKAKDIEMLIQDNENLQLKLVNQEQEFQLQNATMLQELSSLVSVNEKLEREIACLKGSESSAKVSVSQSSTELLQLQDEARKLKAENSALHNILEEVKSKHEEDVRLLRNSISCLKQPQQDESGVIEVGAEEVSFHKCNNSTMNELFQQVEERIKVMDKQFQENEDNKMQLFALKEENQLLKQQLETLQSSNKQQWSNLEEEVERLKEKLKKKQESIIQLQQEKEALYTENKKSYEDLQSSKEQEISHVKDQNQRLQTQLNNNSQNYQDYREKTNKMIEELENRISGLESQIDRESSKRADELEREKDLLSTNLKESQEKSESLAIDLERINNEVQDLKARLENTETLNNQLSSEKAELLKLSDESKAVADKRKLLIDEMAKHMQKESDTHQQQLEHITKELTKKIAELTEEVKEEKEKTEKMEKMKSRLDDLQTEVKSLEGTKHMLEKHLEKSELAMEDMKCHYETLLSETNQENENNLEKLRSDFELQIKDIETQLEISNAQRTEYEEAVAKLKQEAKDSIEDRKIHEKKGTSIVKDLKRQLLMERKRAERLQERLQEFLNDSTQIPSIDTNAFKPPTDAGDRAETSSISSWSMMSGGQLDSTRDTHDGSGTGSSLHNGNSPTPPSVLEQENADLLCRIGTLQQEKWILEEKVNHLEQSTAAMADDMMQKQAIIQYYCMEGRTDPPHHLHFDKLTVKRVVDFIKDKGDVNQQEINRKLLRSLEETLTKNMCLQKDLEALSQQLAKTDKTVESDCVAVST